MIELSTWTDEDLRAGLEALADLRKEAAVQMVTAVIAYAWNEAMHPRDSNGEFSVSGNAEGRNIVDSIVSKMHDGMTQRSKQTHLHIYHQLKSGDTTASHASHYWQAYINSKKQGILIHPRDAFGKANMAIHTGDLSHLQATPKTPGVKPAKAGSPQFVTVKEFKSLFDDVKKIDNEGVAYLETIKTGKGALRQYTASWYATINPSLREGVVTADERHKIEQLDAALRDTQTSANLVVYRRYGNSALVKIKKAGVGGIFQDPGFHSTTMNIDTNRVRVEIPKGSPGLAIQSISHYPGEHEFLLPRESEFEIIKVSSGSAMNEGEFVLRYIGSGKATHRPDVQASLTITKVEVQPPSKVPVLQDHVETHVNAPAAHIPGTIPVSNILGVGAKKVDGPHGSQPGQWWQTAGGIKVYVKPMPIERAANEAGANAAYKAMKPEGASLGSNLVPNVWVVQDGDHVALASQNVPTLQTFSAEQWQSPTSEVVQITKEKAASLWAVDAILSNWDVVGLGYDNIASNGYGGVTRIDSGGAMKYRAQGGIKESWKVGGAWTEPWTMRGKPSPQGGKPGVQTGVVFGGISDTQAANALLELKSRMTVDKMLAMKAQWKNHGMSDADIQLNAAVIQERLNAIPGVASLLNQSNQ